MYQLQAVGCNTGVISGLLALLAGAGHMLTDSTGLIIALVAATLATPPQRRPGGMACSGLRCWLRW